MQATAEIRDSDSTLRVGVVGLGARANLALHSETAENNSRIVAAADPSPYAQDRLHNQLSRDFSVDPDISAWSSTDIDIAFVLSPDDTHAAVTCDLLEKGIAVYLEKPLAIWTEDATRILETAYRTRTPLYVGHNMRHMSVVKTLKRVIDQGLIGDVKAIWCRHFVGNGGDYYFKDWHAEQARVNSLLLQKGAHDIDVMHWLAGGYTKTVVGMGNLGVYGGITDRRDNHDRLKGDWFSMSNWPPLSQTDLNPTIDVEDLSMVLMELDNGILTSYQQCHYTPDYWRNYTVIGTAGRAENFGDTTGGVVRVWQNRVTYDGAGTLEISVDDTSDGHLDADKRTVAEFIKFVRFGVKTQTSPIGAWYAAVTGSEAAFSLRNGSIPRDIPALPKHLVQYFETTSER